MSGEYPSGGSGEHPSGSRGWNHDWFGGSPFPSPDTNFSPTPLTQDSQTPGGYRPYPADMQNAPDGQYGWAPEHGSAGSDSTQPLSRIPEGGLRAGVPVRTRGSSGDPNVRTPYTPAEMEKIFDAYVAISEDPDVGTNQTGDRFWGRVARMYNASRPEGTVERNESMLRNTIGRANEAIKKFQGYYLEEQRAAGSGTNEVDIIAGAMAAYQTCHYKPFKHLNTWQKVRHLPKYKGGIQSSSGSSGKRSRSQSSFGSEEVASQLAGAHLDSSDAGPSSSRRRPPGRKTAMANRRRASTPAEPPAIAPFVPPPPPTNSLWAVLNAATNADTARMTPQQLDAHHAMISALRQQLGIPPSN